MGESAGRISALSASVLAWSLAMVVATVALVLSSGPSLEVRVRLSVHAYDLGHSLALCLVSGVVVLAAERLLRGARFGRNRTGLSSLTAFVCALGLGAFVLPEDLINLADRLSTEILPAPLLVALLVTSVAALLPAALLLGLVLARRRLRPLGLGLGLTTLALNSLVLRGDYAGVHVFIVLLGVALTASSLLDANEPAFMSATVSSRRVRIVCLTLALPLLSFSVSIWPRPIVGAALMSRGGAILLPFLAAAHRRTVSTFEHPDGVEQPASSRQWFVSRAEAQDVPPSSNALLPRNGLLLLLTIDAARADVFLNPKYAERLPELTRLRASSVSFEQARSPASQTSVTLTTLFSGRYYSQQAWTQKTERGRGMTTPHEDGAPRFPERLAAMGLPTVTYASADYLMNEHGVLRGFTEEKFVKNTPHARELVDLAIARLGRDTDAGLFLFMHFLDAHFPYDRGVKTGSQLDRYVAELAIIDAQIGRLRAAITARGLTDRTAIVLSADHGEAFGEHGKTQHATTLYEELVHVPLFILVPGLRPRRVQTPVSLVDVGPTVLELYGLPTPATFMGESLVPLLRGEEVRLSRPLVLESGRLIRAMYFEDGMKLIVDRHQNLTELYDLSADPRELNNLFQPGEPDSERRLQTLTAYFETHSVERRGLPVAYRR